MGKRNWITTSFCQNRMNDMASQFVSAGRQQLQLEQKQIHLTADHISAVLPVHWLEQWIASVFLTVPIHLSRLHKTFLHEPLMIIRLVKEVHILQTRLLIWGLKEEKKNWITWRGACFSVWIGARESDYKINITWCGTFLLIWIGTREWLEKNTTDR